MACMESSFAQPLKPPARTRHYWRGAGIAGLVTLSRTGTHGSAPIQIAGAIILETDHGPFMSKIWVNPAYRRKGYAHQVLDAVKSRFPHVWWRCKADNPALELYMAASQDRIRCDVGTDWPGMAVDRWVFFTEGQGSRESAQDRDMAEYEAKRRAAQWAVALMSEFQE